MGTMKTKDMKPGDKVDLPDGTVGEYVATDKFGEAMFILEDGKTQAWFFIEDLEPVRLTEQPLCANPRGLIPGERG